jgi:folate-binding protein YgfZ
MPTTTSFVVDANQRARVLVRGVDAPAFLHRLCTQHVKDLTPGDARLSALTTDKGRLVDVVHHVVLEEGIVLVGTVLGTDALCAWLDRYFFTEKLEFAATGTSAVVVDSQSAGAIVAGADALAPWASARAGSVLAVRTFDRVVDGVAVPAVLLLALDGATLPTPNTDVEVDADRLVAAGAPLAEISEAHTPLDLELHDAIHWAKGCYIGQEVIARLDTYGKQRKRLMAVDSADTIRVSDAVSLEGSTIGAVTSVGSNGVRGLAMVKLASDVDDMAAVVGAAAVSVRLRRRHAAQQPHD